jgi:hypothetical protein
MPSPEYRGGGGGGGGGSDKEDPELRERCAGGSFDPPARPRFDFDGIGRVPRLSLTCLQVHLE